MDSTSDARQWIDTWKHRQKPPTLQLWKMCIKIPMYTVALVPVAIATAAAYVCTGRFAAVFCCKLMLGSSLVIAWLNLSPMQTRFRSNDGFDAATGVDNKEHKPESIVNLTGLSPAIILALSAACLLSGVWFMAEPYSALQDSLPAVLLTAAIACGYLYQGPPFRWSYRGLGEPLTFIAFGPLSVSSFFLCLAMPHTSASATTTLQSQMMLVGPMALVVGLTTMVILFCSHFHQIKGDREAGKKSPLTKLGGKRGSQVLQVLCVATHVLALCTTAMNPVLQPWSGLTLLAVPAAVKLCSFAAEHYRDPQLVKPLKLIAIKWHSAMGTSLFLLLLAAGVDMHGAESLVT